MKAGGVGDMIRVAGTANKTQLAPGGLLLLIMCDCPMVIVYAHRLQDSTSPSPE